MPRDCKKTSLDDSLPNFLIIGAMKSGTTSLYHCLRNHPQINMSPKKEINFFIGRHFNENKSGWYAGHFDDRAGLKGEASTSYTKYPIYRYVPQRIFAMMPKVKLIYLVRDPLERLTSHFCHETIEGRGPKSFVSLFEELQTTKFFYTSLYYFQLTQYLHYFQKNKILVLSLDEFERNIKETLAKVCCFLSIDDFLESSIVTKHCNSREEHILKYQANNTEDSSLFARLVDPMALKKYLSFDRSEKYAFLKRKNAKAYESLKEDVVQFRALTGYTFKDWGV